MKIQFAQRSDLAAIVDIYNQSIRNGTVTGHMEEFDVSDRDAWFQEFDEDSYPLYVAKDGEAVVGYATLSPYRKGRQAMRKIAEVSYFLDFDQRGRGIGSQLMDYVLKDCQRLEIDTLLAILLGVNEESITFLKKWQFEEWGRLPDIIDFDTYRCDHLIYGRRV